MVEECAGLIVWCRAERLKLLTGGAFNITSYCTATNSLRRMLADIGLEARMLDITPDDTIEAIVARQRREATDGN
jgi:hypothetical protein